MITSSALRPRNSVTPTWTRPELVSMSLPTASGQTVTVETSKRIATAYRAANIITDGIGKMPLQALVKRGGKVQQMPADWQLRNIAYLIGVKPNRWMNPFIFKKTLGGWLVHHGNAYAWSPLVSTPELFILPADVTFPIFDKNGNLWFQTTFASGEKMFIPDAEMLHLMINSVDGITGKGVVAYARETLGRQQGAHQTMSSINARGMNASAVMQINGVIDEEARTKVKDEYTRAIGGSENAGGLAVIDLTVAQFTPITMKAIDMQFLETMAATDTDIANYYGVPLHMLNKGKQAYNSNDQKYLEYLGETLDPYLVQWEDEARTKWLPLSEQPYTEFKFVREALLRMSPVTRASMNEVLIRSAQRSPNETREKDDLSSYPGGEHYYMSSSIKEIGGENAIQ